MLEFEVRGVWDSWNVLWPGSVMDAVDFTVRTDACEEIQSYESVDTFVQLFECSVMEIPTSDHPMSELSHTNIKETTSGIRLRMSRCSIDTTYIELRNALEPFLAEVFTRIDDRTADELDDPERIQIYVERINDRWPLLFDFTDLHDQLTTTGSYSE